MKKNVLIVGAGRRARGTMIPAFWCMRDSFNIVGVLTRSINELSLFQDKFKIITINSIEGVDLSKVDIIATAIPVNQVKAFLSNFNNIDVSHITLILDTPVINIKNIGTLRKLKIFKKVLIAEDFISLPQVVLIKEVIKSGKIGKLKYINIFHGGFKHHALAMIKAITSSNFITLIKSNKYFGEFRVKKIRSNGVTVEMIEPRDYEVHRTLIVGSHGVVSDYPISYDKVYSYRNLINLNRFVSLESESLDISKNNLDIFFQDNIQYCTEEVSIINDQKIRGYIEIINSIDKKDSPYNYLPIDAIYDDLSIRISDKFGLFIDLGWKKFSIFKTLLYLLSRVLPA